MGLLDWITDGGGSLWSGGASPPPPQPDAAMRPTGAPIPQMSFQRPEFANPPPAQPPAQPPMPPGAQPAQPPMTGDFDQNGLPPARPGMPPAPPQAGAMPPPDPSSMGSPAPPSAASMPPPPPPPLPVSRPAGASAPPSPGAIPPPPPEQPPVPPMNGAPSPTYPGAGVALQRAQNPGDAGLLGAFGMNPHDATMLRGSLGAGLKAAGESAGKSPFQAFSGGAGAALEGGDKASDKNNDQTIKYLNAAISAQRAGDTAAYNTNYTKYLAAKLKADTEKAASTNAKGNSPEQLYLSAARLTNTDPRLKGANDAIREARSRGDTAGVAQAQAALAQKQAEIMQEHSVKVGLDPKTAAQIGQQPGMTKDNAIDAGKQGITEKNIAQKLQPGQYYRNPKDGQIYQFNGGPGNGKTPTIPTSPEPRDPNKPERGSRAAAPDSSDESES